MEAPQIELTLEQEEAIVVSMEKFVEKHQLNLKSGDDLYKLAKATASKLIGSATAGFMHWDDLPDTNSLWDAIDPDIPMISFLRAIVDVCNERLEGAMD